MNCKCGSKRIVDVVGKTSDLCNVRFTQTGKEKDGYVPDDMNIGGGDYLDFSLCLNCGQIQGEWPLEIFEEEDSNEN